MSALPSPEPLRCPSISRGAASSAAVQLPGGAGGPLAGLTDGWQRGNGRELIDGSVPGSASGTGQLLEEGGRGKKPDAEQRGGRRMRAACLAEGLKWEQAAAQAGWDAGRRAGLSSAAAGGSAPWGHVGVCWH